MSILSALICCGTASIQDGKASIVLLQLLFVVIIVVLRTRKLSDDPLRALRDVELFEDRVLTCQEYNNATYVIEREECLKIQLTYRWAWSAACIFLTLMLVTMCGFGAKALTSCFFIKLLTPVAIFFGLLFAPDSFFDDILYVGGFLAVGVCIVVFIFLICFALKWNNWWAQNMTDDKSEGKSGICWQLGIIFVSLLFFGASVFGLVTLVKDEFKGSSREEIKTYFFMDEDPLNLRRVLVIGTFIVMLGCTIFSILSCVKHGNILTSALVMAFVMSLCWGATLNNKYDIRNTEYISSQLLPYLGLMSAWVFVGLVMSAQEVDSVGESNFYDTDGKASDRAEIYLSMNNLEVWDDEYMETVSEDEIVPQVDRTWTAIFFLLHAGIPVAIMSLVSVQADTSRNVQFWVYSGVIGLCLVLYVLHLILPILCSRRRKFT